MSGISPARSVRPKNQAIQSSTSVGSTLSAMAAGAAMASGRKFTRGQVGCGGGPLRPAARGSGGRELGVDAAGEVGDPAVVVAVDLAVGFLQVDARLVEDAVVGGRVRDVDDRRVRAQQQRAGELARPLVL